MCLRGDNGGVTTSADRPAGGGTGHVGWEIVEVATGRVVDRGSREVKTTQIETMVNPPAPFPRVGPDVFATAAGLFGWLVTRGGPRTVKRVRLGAGFWLVLPERPRLERPLGMALRAERDRERTFCWEWFDLEDGGATATKLQETGRLQLQWTRNRHGHQELTQVEFLTDVSLRLTGSDSDIRHPRWRVRVLAGSVVPWPESGNGVQLVPHLRPGRPPG